MCNCPKFGNLQLNQKDILLRESLFDEIVSELKQKSQKLVERWLEHYRLYQCTKCDQMWQASICMQGDFDTPKLLYKVPTIKITDWKKEPYVAPDTILRFIEQLREYMSSELELSESLCQRDGCDSKALKSCDYCQLHHFHHLAESNATWSKPKGRWFGPYGPELLLAYR